MILQAVECFCQYENYYTSINTADILR